MSGYEPKFHAPIMVWRGERWTYGTGNPRDDRKREPIRRPHRPLRKEADDAR